MKGFSPEATRAVTRAVELAGTGAVGAGHLFVGALDSDFGQRVLAELGLSMEQLQDALTATDPLKPDPLQTVWRAVLLTSPDGDECVEQVLLALLGEPEGLLSHLLRNQGLDGFEFSNEVMNRLSDGAPWTRYDSEEAWELAAQQGCPHAGEAHYLQVTLQRDSVARQVLEELGADLARLQREAAAIPLGTQPCGPPGGRAIGAVELAHLVFWLSRDPDVEQLTLRAGVIPFRWAVAVRRIDPRFPELPASGGRMPWATPACQEARRLRCGCVTAENLLLGLLADPHSPACSALKAAGVDLAALRRQLEAAPCPPFEAEMDFTAQARQAMEAAVESAGNVSPDSAHCLHGLTQHDDQPVARLLSEHLVAVRRAIGRQIRGTLDPTLPVFVDGITLGMTRAEVLDALGEPSDRHDVAGTA